MKVSTIKISKNVAEILNQTTSLFTPSIHWLFCKETCCSCGTVLYRKDATALKIIYHDENGMQINRVEWACNARHAILFVMQYHPRYLEWRYQKYYTLNAEGL